MDKNAVQKAVPVNSDSEVNAEDLLDFQSGHVQRAIGKFAKIGKKLPWRLVQNYLIVLVMFRMATHNDGKLQHSKRR